MQPGAKAVPRADGGIETESAAHRAAARTERERTARVMAADRTEKRAHRGADASFSHGRRARACLWALAAALVLLFLLSFLLGRFGVPVRDAARILLYRLAALVEDGLGALAGRPVALLPETVPWEAQMEAVVISIRLPRILLACLVGCSLSGAGAAYQSVFQNPMAAPDILGASSGAAFGAALAILLGLPARLITLAAFAAGMVTVLLVDLVGQRAPGKRVVNLILAGVMVSSLFSAGTSFIKLVADPANQLPAITYWLMGSLAGARLADAGFAAIPMALGLVPLVLLRWRLNILTLGDGEARAMGVHAGRLRLAAVLCATLVTAASVSVSGMIGWVGLVIPHLSRKLVGSDHRYLIPASMLLGAAFLLAVDNVSRNLLASEIPIGILTAFIGAPFFLYLILRRERAA